MKKPKIEEFTEICRKCRGIKSRIADALGVNRGTVHDWINKDARFRKAVEEQQGRFFDDLLKTAESLALGIPKVKNGKRVGWEEEPNVKVLTYLLGKFGRNEGFGDSIDITSKGESIKPEPITVEIIDNRDKVSKE